MKKYLASPHLLTILLSCGMAAGCSESPTEPDHEVLFETVHHSQYSGIERSRQQVIRDPAEWSRVWTEIGAGGAPPRVDFGRDMVVLAAAGDQPDGCHDIAIRSMRVAAGQLDVNVERTVPGPGCGCPAVMTQAVHAVVVSPRVSGGAAFAVQQRQLVCL